MLKGNVMSVEERKINDKVFYKTLIAVHYDNGIVLCERYLQEKKEVNKDYKVMLDHSNDMKFLTVKLGEEIITAVDDSRKGIFNK